MIDNINTDLLNSANSTISVNPLKYPSVVCDNCGCETFIPGYVFKKIPGVALGRGMEEQIVPIEVCVCSKCGELMPEYKAKAEEAQKNNDNVNLII